jgi:hypothetical protein
MAFVKACEQGNFPEIFKRVNQGDADVLDNLEIALKKAVRFAQKDVVDFLLRHYDMTVLKTATAFQEACQQGHLSIVQMLIEYAERNSQCKTTRRAMRRAGEFIKPMVNSGLCVAARYNQLPTLKFLIGKGATAFDRAFANACCAHSIACVNYLMSTLKCLDVNIGLIASTEGEHLDLVQFFVKSGATSFRTALFTACSNHTSEIFVWLYSNYARSVNLQHCLELAVSHEQSDIVEFILGQTAFTPNFVKPMWLLAPSEIDTPNHYYDKAKIATLFLQNGCTILSNYFYLPRDQEFLLFLLHWRPSRSALVDIIGMDTVFRTFDQKQNRIKQDMKHFLIPELVDLCLAFHC